MTAPRPPLPQLPAVADLAGVRQRYGRVVALDNLTLSLPAGQLVGLIGPDGVGKSTLLALVSGARRLQHGKVQVLGGNMAHARWRAVAGPRIAYMPQGLGRNLYPDLSVRENLDFFGRLFGKGGSERRERVAALLRATGLYPFQDRLARQLSGGMKQKLGLCCALVHDPDLLILDEPTTGVDPLSRRQFWQLVQGLRAHRPGMSVLVATAYMEEAEDFEWLVAMDGGRVLAAGSAATLRGRTGSATLEDAFVALLPQARRAGYRMVTIPPRSGGAVGPPAIEAKDLTRRFGRFTAVDRVSLRVERGEIFGFLGSNGCGKTTTMKMLTGLLPTTDGKAMLSGRPVAAGDMAARRRVGYMSQSFSLYGELSVRQNLELHARLFHLPMAAARARITELVARFGLQGHLQARAGRLPLGLRQRLSLAVAVLHAPEVLILDEPTSGVDPVARSQFWELLAELARRDGVTIFISTHFLNEASRCDRISLMHAGRILATGAPDALVQARGAATLEEAFIGYLAEAGTTAPVLEMPMAKPQPPQPMRMPGLRRLLAIAWREALELSRDPVRLFFSLLGTAMLMLIFGYGITMDVEGLSFAVLDRDVTPDSRAYVQEFSTSRFFTERPPIANDAALQTRMQRGEIQLAIEIPPGFGRDLHRGRPTEVAAWVDGAMPFRAETIRGYVQGVHETFLSRTIEQGLSLATVETRFRYNQDFKSVYAMVPGVIMLLLVLIPAILTALGVVREKELGSITNLHVTPTRRLEFLLGKHLPYIALAALNAALLAGLAVLLFDVPLKGSATAFGLGALLYVTATTGIGLLVSSFTTTQIAALFGTAILTMLPTTQFSGMVVPVSALEGAGAVMSRLFPATYFLQICLGSFTKALDLRDLILPLLALAAFIPALLLMAAMLLPKQER